MFTLSFVYAGVSFSPLPLTLLFFGLVALGFELAFEFATATMLLVAAAAAAAAAVLACFLALWFIRSTPTVSDADCTWLYFNV